MKTPETYKEVYVKTYQYDKNSITFEIYHFYDTTVFDAQMDMVSSGRFKETPWYKIFSKKNKMELFAYSSLDSIDCYAEEWLYINKNNFKQIW